MMASIELQQHHLHCTGLGLLGHSIGTKDLICPIDLPSPVTWPIPVGLITSTPNKCRNGIALGDYLFMVFFYIEDKLSRVL